MANIGVNIQPKIMLDPHFAEECEELPCLLVHDSFAEVLVVTIWVKLAKGIRGNEDMTFVSNCSKSAGQIDPCSNRISMPEYFLEGEGATVKSDLPVELWGQIGDAIRRKTRRIGSLRRSAAIRGCDCLGRHPRRQG